MTLAALLMILFFLPGFIFQLAYYNTENIALTMSLTHRAVASSLMTLILHAIGCLVWLGWAGQAVHFNIFLMLLSGGQADTLGSMTNDTILLTVFYLAGLYCLSFCIGIVLRWGIKTYHLDRYRFFRIDNPWYDLFKGLNWEKGQPDGVKIAATMQIADRPYLYVGVLDHFFLNKEGHIDRLVLVYTSRRLLENDKGCMDESERFYPIDGHYFVLKYDEIKNLNVEYFDVKDQGEITVKYITP